MAALDAHEIRRHLPDGAGRWLTQLEVFETIDSTNTHLMANASVESVAGRAAVAEHQSAGRGRRGRAWKSPHGQSIALSLGTHVEVPATRLGAVSLVVGLAVVRALDRCGVVGVGLKWPNDVVLNGAKLGGILIEVVPARQPCEVVIGVGINVARDPELVAVVDPVATISDVVATIDRNLVVARLIESIHGHVRRFEAEGFAPFRGAWQAANVHRDARVAVLLGEARIEGRVLGVGEAGELVLGTAEGERRFTSGEVSLRPI
jgi:BirA family biotin operon repressor/biotin-[acetyl-CoA-carboxylase] ligase